jgi:universal stress protein E
VAGLLDGPAVEPHVHVGPGPAADEILACVDEVDPDLVVMGTVSRTGVPGLLIGNTAEKLLDRLDCSLLAVKPQGFRSPVEAA